jgi:hypothetical protein
MIRLQLSFSAKVREWFSKWLYQQLLALFLIKGSPSKVKIFKLIFNLDPQKFTEVERLAESVKYLLKLPAEERATTATSLNFHRSLDDKSLGDSVTAREVTHACLKIIMVDN